MGGIIYWTLIRTAILIPILLLLFGLIDYKFWWMIGIISIYVIIIHPTIIQYKAFKEKNKEILNDSLCSTCIHFDESAVLCMKYDKHPTKDDIPCGGMDWEPK